MKKLMILTAILLAVAVTTMLSQAVSDPEAYTGEWYSANSQCIYLFQEGIIYCQKHAIPLSDGSIISGAYSFSGDTIVLFAAGVEGLETVQELYLVENREEVLLCDNKEGNGRIFFIRANQIQ